MATQRKKLGLGMLIALVTGNMIGSGIFMLPANLAAFGSISLFSWIFTGTGALLLALVFSRLSLFVPNKSGGPYTYAHEGFGKFVGFQTGYCYWVNIWVGNAAIAISCIGYLRVFFPELASPVVATTTSIVLIWILTFINTRNVRFIGGFQVVTTILKLVPIFLIMGFSARYFHFSYLMQDFNISGQSDFSAFSSAASITLWAFIGLESAAVVGENVENPKRNIPLATIVGTLIATLVYISCSMFIMGLIPAETLSHSTAPFADAAKLIFGSSGAIIVTLGAVIACLGTLNGMILLQGQVSMAAADDGMFPHIFAKRNRHGMPALGQIITTVMVTGILLFTISDELTKQFQLIALVATSMAIISYFYTALANIVLLGRENHKISFFNKDILIALGAAAYSLWAYAGSGQEVIFYGAILLVTSIVLYTWLLFIRNREGERIK